MGGIWCHSLPSGAAVSSRETNVYDLEASCHTGRTPGPTWRLANHGMNLDHLFFSAQAPPFPCQAQRNQVLSQASPFPWSPVPGIVVVSRGFLTWLCQHRSGSLYWAEQIMHEGTFCQPDRAQPQMAGESSPLEQRYHLLICFARNHISC